MLYCGLILFFILEYIRPIKYLPFLTILHLNTVIPVCVAFFSAMNNKILTNEGFLKYTSTKIMLVLFALLCVSIITADVTYYAYGIITQVFGWFLIYFVIMKNVDEQKSLVGIFAILSICHLVIIILSPENILNPEVRSYITQESFLGDGNDFALSLNIVIPMCIYIRYISKLKIIKLFYLVLTILFVLSIIGTSSRGGSLALVAVLFYQWIKSKNKLIGLVGAVVLILIVISYAPSQYFERMGTIRNYETEGSAQGRIAIWKSGIRMVVDHPLIGVGAGHFAVKYGTEYRPPGIGRTDIPWSNAHSLYIQILAELGFPGLAAYLGLIFVNLVRNERIIRSSIINEDSNSFHTEKHLFVCLNSSLIGFAVGGAFLSVAYYPHIFILAGVMEAARRMYERQQESKGEDLVLAVR